MLTRDEYRHLMRDIQAASNVDSIVPLSRKEVEAIEREFVANPSPPSDSPAWFDDWFLAMLEWDNARRNALE